MILAIVGATGTGKSALALDLARRWSDSGRPVEIVNADAMQLYRGMDIGTAKTPEAERRGIPHHLLDVLDVTEEASVARYQEDARRTIDAITERGATPLLVGGSGLYVAAVLTDFRFPGTDPERRAHWEAVLAERGPAALHEQLRQRDPVAAEAIGPHNGRRIVRALEVGDLTGEPFSAGLAARERPWRPYRQVGLQLERSALVPRLERGVTASRAIGYAQAIGQLRGALDERAAISETQSLTRRYARRQVSWFRRDDTVHWVDAAAEDRRERAERALAHGSDGTSVGSMGR